MNSFKGAVVWASACDSSRWAHQQRSTSQCNNTSICELLTFDQADSPKLRELCQLHNTSIRQPSAAGQINVSDSVASLDQIDNSRVSYVGTVSQVNVMEILREFTDRVDRAIGDISTLGQHKISQARSCWNNSCNGIVSDLFASCQIKYAQ